jgi:hypothetical protein
MLTKDSIVPSLSQPSLLSLLEIHDVTSLSVSSFSSSYPEKQSCIIIDIVDEDDKKSKIKSQSNKEQKEEYVSILTIPQCTCNFVFARMATR